MRTFEFAIILDGSPELTEELADRLFAAGCDDGTPGMCAGSTTIDFHREALSLEDAIRSAVADVNAAGCVAAHVQIDAENIAVSP